MIIKPQSKIKDNENGLYLVSTPIGNLKDITLRAIETLNTSSYILCDDTRVSKILLDRSEVPSRLISNHKFHEQQHLTKLLNLFTSASQLSFISYSSLSPLLSLLVPVPFCFPSFLCLSYFLPFY